MHGLIAAEWLNSKCQQKSYTCVWTRCGRKQCIVLGNTKQTTTLLHRHHHVSHTHSLPHKNECAHSQPRIPPTVVTTCARCKLPTTVSQLFSRIHPDGQPCYNTIQLSCCLWHSWMMSRCSNFVRLQRVLPECLSMTCLVQLHDTRPAIVRIGGSASQSSFLRLLPPVVTSRVLEEASATLLWSMLKE